MEDFKTLKFLDKFKFLFEKFGVDYKIMRRILQLKFIMDSRRVSPIIANSNMKESDNTFKKSLIMYGITGVFLMLIMLLALPVFMKMAFGIGAIMFMIMSVMISDFSSVLLDVKDKNIMLSKPVDIKTINAAKIIHISIYMFFITIAIAGPTLILGLIKHGIVFFIIFAIQLIFISAFIIFLTSILYFLILVFFDGEKLKDIINYFQIILSVIMIVGYQLVGRIFDFTNLASGFSPKWWHYFIPSIWFASPYSLFLEHTSTNYIICMSILSILIPIVVFVLYFKFVVPYFEKNLQKLNNNSSTKNSSIEKKTKRHKKLINIFCSNNTENIFLRFTKNMLSSERTFKLKLYPNLAFSIIMPLIFIYNDVSKYNSWSKIRLILPSGKHYLKIYVTTLLLAACVNMITSSEKYKGAWIYKVLPIENPSVIYKGAVKGFILKIISPLYLFLSFIFIMLCGFNVVPHLILIFLNMLLLIMFLFTQSSKRLPFSKDFNNTTEDNSIGTFIMSALITGLCSALHYLLTFTKYGVTVFSLILLILVVILWKKVFKLSWDTVYKNL
jgi:hypothetical protein